MNKTNKASIVALLAVAGCCIGQDAPAPEARREVGDVAGAYYWARIDHSCTLRLTPDVVVHALLAVAIATVHRVDDRMVWALRRAESVGDEGFARSRVATLADRQAVCGAAFTPVWGDEESVKLEMLVARLAAVGLDPWASVPADLSATAVGLWGKHAGLHHGLSPVSGGYADTNMALGDWRERCRVSDIDKALDGGGVIGVLLYRCLRPDRPTEKALLGVLKRSRSWRYNPQVLWNKSATLHPGAAVFVGERRQWRAAHAAAQSLLRHNLRLRDEASSKLERRMWPSGAVFTQSVVRWLEDMMPLLAAGAEGRDVDVELARQLDWLFQPPVLLAWYLSDQNALGVSETWEREFFRARMVAK